MEHQIRFSPSYAMVEVELSKGEKFVTEAGAMAWMEGPIDVKTSTRGGLLTGLKRRAFSGESFFQNTYTATGDGARIGVAPGVAGDVIEYPMQDGELVLQRGAYLASDPGVICDSKWEGFRGFFSGEGMVLLQARGEGDLWFNTYGAMLEIDVRDGYFVDTGYIVAFEDTLQYEVTVLPGLSIGSKIKSFFFGGEGLVCRFSGEGKLWIQTRTVNPFLSWIYPYRPQQQNN